MYLLCIAKLCDWKEGSFSSCECSLCTLLQKFWLYQRVMFLTFNLCQKYYPLSLTRHRLNPLFCAMINYYFEYKLHNI